MGFRKYYDRLKDQWSEDHGEHQNAEPPAGEIERTAGHQKNSPADPGQNKPGHSEAGPPSGRRKVDPLDRVKNQTDDSVYRARSKHAARVEEMFWDFGPAVCSYVFTQSVTPGGIMRILDKLELHTRFREGADLAQISQWIVNNGVDAFCERVKIRQRNDQPKSIPGKEKEGEGRLKEEPELRVRPLDVKRRREIMRASGEVVETPQPSHEQEENPESSKSSLPHPPPQLKRHSSPEEDPGHKVSLETNDQPQRRDDKELTLSPQKLPGRKKEAPPKQPETKNEPSPAKEPERETPAAEENQTPNAFLDQFLSEEPEAEPRKKRRRRRKK